VLKRTGCLFLLLLPLVAMGGEVKKWMDKEGVVHFGDIAPTAIDYSSAPVRPLTGGKGLSTKQLKQAKELDRREQNVQKAKFNAEKNTAKRYREQQSIEAAYRKGKLVKGLSEKQLKSLLGEPNRIEKKETKSGLRQKWSYDEAREGVPQTVILENGLYSRHQNKKGKR